MIDYAFKSQVLKTDCCDIERQVSFSIYKAYYNKTLSVQAPFSPDMAKDVEDAYKIAYGEKFWEEASKINYAYYKRVKRLKDKIEKMLASGTCLFLSLTFTNEVLDSTSEETRKKYIKNFLKSVSDTYIANIDYGKLNEREHYHAVVLANKITDKQRQQYNDLCGNINFKRIRKTSDITKIAKYVSKLTNHAIKETTRRNAIIYSR